MTQPQDFSAGATAGAWHDSKPTALLVLADGTVLEGIGFGASGHAVGEVCFNTAMTGYEEILTDPSYAGQIITFTFPHIGNVGTNDEDIEDFGIVERESLGGAGLALEDLGLDQPQRRHTARVAGLQGIRKRRVDLVAQHSYGLF